MPLLANTPSLPSPRRPSWRWLYAPLLLTLVAPVTLAEPPAARPEPDFAAESARAESSGKVVRVAPDHETNLTVRGAERVRVDARDVAVASLGEANQVMVRGLRPGRAELLVWRKDKRPLLLRVEVAQ